jgi:hypothetical protein
LGFWQIGLLFVVLAPAVDLLSEAGSRLAATLFLLLRQKNREKKRRRLLRGGGGCPAELAVLCLNSCRKFDFLLGCWRSGCFYGFDSCLCACT